MRRTIAIVAVLILVAVLAWTLRRRPNEEADTRGQSREVVRVDVSAGDIPRATFHVELCICADGRVLAFASNVPGLVPGDTNATNDVFAHDVRTGRTEMISVGPSGEPGNGPSRRPSISADGRLVAFWSLATDLVPGDSGRGGGIYLRDREAGVTEKVAGSFSHASLSADGRFVALGPGSVSVKDRQTGAIERLVVAGTSEPVQWGGFPAISGDGRFVAYTEPIRQDRGASGAALRQPDLILYDRHTRAAERIAEEVLGAKGISLSADGRFVAFTSASEKLVDRDPDGIGWSTLVYVRETRKTERVRAGSPAGRADASDEAASISADGRFVAFVRTSNRVAQVFVRDRRAGRNVIVSADASGAPGDGSCWSLPRISGDGRYVVFQSMASNLVPGDDNGKTDIFVARNPLAP